MTRERWRTAIDELRAKLNKGAERKVAMLAIRVKYKVSDPSIYVWCKVFGVTLK